MTKAYTTRRQAIAKVRESTGLSVDVCRLKVNQLPRTKDGLREKVAASHVRQLIAEMSRPPVPRDVGIRPLSDKHRAMAKASAITSQVVERLKAQAAA